MYKAIYGGCNSIYNYIVGAHVVQLTGNSLKNQAGKKYTAKMNMKQKKITHWKKNVSKNSHICVQYLFSRVAFYNWWVVICHLMLPQNPNPLKRISQATMELEKKIQQE